MSGITEEVIDFPVDYPQDQSYTILLYSVQPLVPCAAFRTAYVEQI